MPYTRTTWQDYPSTATPITASALNNIESYLEALPAGVVARAQLTSATGGITNSLITGLQVSWTASSSRLYLTQLYFPYIRQDTASAGQEVRIADPSYNYFQSATRSMNAAQITSYFLQVYETGLSGTITRVPNLICSAGSITNAPTIDRPAQIIVMDLGEV